MQRGLKFGGSIRCDQPGCDYEMEFEATYTGHVLDKVCVRIDRLESHRASEHTDVVRAEEAAEEAPRG